MVFAEDIRKEILKLADQRGPKSVFYLSEVAKIIDPHNWMKQAERVQLVAEALVQEGYIIIAMTNRETKETAYSKSTG